MKADAIADLVEAHHFPFKLRPDARRLTESAYLLGHRDATADLRILLERTLLALKRASHPDSELIMDIVEVFEEQRWL
jgi:hypothetical protein